MEKRTARKSILDRSFKYTPSVQTDIRKTFRKERARLSAMRRVQQGALEAGSNVSKLNIPGRTTAALGRRGKAA